MGNIFEILNKTLMAFRTMKFPGDYLDIIIVAILIYIVINFARQTRAGQLLRGIILIFVLLQVAKLMNLSLLGYVLENTIQLSFIAVFIVFQPELRAGLERIGRTNIKSFKNLNKMSDNEFTTHIQSMINNTCDCCKELSQKKIGGLIVFEVSTRLGDIITTGTPINADITSRTMITIFFPNTPLHDGAIIIKDFKIVAAGCLLPLSQQYEISKSLGTRHRAAVGMSELSDAFVVVVSEETGKISYARNGEITLGITVNELREQMERTFAPAEKKGIISRFFKKKTAAK